MNNKKNQIDELLNQASELRWQTSILTDLQKQIPSQNEY